MPPRRGTHRRKTTLRGPMSVNRRTLLASAPALGFAGSAFAEGTTPGAAAPAATTAPAAPAGAAQQAPGFYRYKIADIEITAVNDGVWSRPLDPGFVRNAPIEEVKKAQEVLFLPTDITPVPFTTSVLKTGGKIVLIDTGNGNMGAPGTGTWM